MPALRRRAPTVRFITFDTLVTGVRAFECAFSVFTSSLVHGLSTRRADLAAVFTVFALFAAFFKAFGISKVLLLNEAHIITRDGDDKADLLTYTDIGYNWFMRVLHPVEEEIRRIVRDERAKDSLISVSGLEHALEKHFNRGFSHQYVSKIADKVSREGLIEMDRTRIVKRMTFTREN